MESFSKPGFRFLARWPSAAAMRAARQRARELTDRLLLLLPVEDVVANLNRVLTGWAGYFRWGNSTVQFHKLDRHVAERLGRWIGMRHQAQRPLAYGLWRLRQERFLGPPPARRARPLRARACGQVKDVGEPCEGKPHARFDVAVGGDQASRAISAARPGRLPPTRPRRGVSGRVIRVGLVVESTILPAAGSDGGLRWRA